MISKRSALRYSLKQKAEGRRSVLGVPHKSEKRYQFESSLSNQSNKS